MEGKNGNLGLGCRYTSFGCGDLDYHDNQQIYEESVGLSDRPPGAGRYLLAVASGEAALGMFTFVASLESSYISGFAVSPFWGRITSMIMIILALTGYCMYRFREPRAMSMGQFLEMRYNRPGTDDSDQSADGRDPL